MSGGSAVFGLDSAGSMGSRPITLPWGAWSGTDEQRAFDFPAGWSVETLDYVGWDRPVELELSALRKAVRQCAEGSRTVSIAIEDTTRPARLASVLEAVLAELGEAGIEGDAIDIVVALGAHAPPPAPELELKVGKSVLAKHAIRFHDAHSDLHRTEIMIGDLPLRIDPVFARADCRIGIGVIMPNPFAGFSGAGKIVLPGLADIDALEWLHKIALMGFGGGVARTGGNRVRTEIDRVAVELPLHLSICCLVDSSRKTRELVFGDPVEVHARGASRAREIYRTPMSGRFDVLFCNAYPKDGEFLQVENAYTALRTGAMSHLNDGGSVVLMASCHRGRGAHGLFDAGERLHRKPTAAKPFFRGAAGFVYSPGIDEADCRVTHWEGYPFFQEWTPLLSALLERHGPTARVGVFPAGSLQLGPA